MTSKTLFNKKGLGFIKNYISSNSWLFLVTLLSICSITIIPLMLEILKSSYNDLDTTNKINILHILKNFDYGFFMLTFALGGINAIDGFRYLNSKSEVDMYHSLPITRNNIFIVRYVVGIIYFLIPFLINILLFVLIGVFSGYGDTLNFTEVAKVVIYNILLFTSSYSFGVFATVITGNVFLMFCVWLGFMVFLPANYLAISNMLYYFLDFFILDNTIFYEVIEKTVPFIAYQEKYAIALVIQTVVMGILAYVCFNKRPSENSSNPIAINIFKPIIKNIGVVSAILVGGNLAMMFSGEYILVFLIGGGIIGLIVNSAFEMLFALDVKMGFKNIKDFVIPMAIISLCVVFIKIDVLGYSDKIAPLEDIESITYNKIEITDSTSIKLLHDYMENVINGTEIKENIIDGSEVTKYYGELLNELTVNLKNGTSYKRQYKAINGRNQVELPIDYINYIEAINEEYVIKYNNYNITEEEIKSGKYFYFQHHGFYDDDTIKREMELEKFLEVYEAILEENHKLTGEYLLSNPLCAKIEFTIPTTDKNNMGYIDGEYTIMYEYKSIPIYSIHEKALDILGVNKDYDLSKHDLSFESIHNSTYFRKNSETGEYNGLFAEYLTEKDFIIDEEDKEAILSKAQYVYSFNNSIYNGSNSKSKNFLYIMDRQAGLNIAYITYDDLDEVLK